MNNNRSHNIHIAAAAIPISGQLVLYLFIIPTITDTEHYILWSTFRLSFFPAGRKYSRIKIYILYKYTDRWREKGLTIEKPIICHRRRSRAVMWNTHTPTALRSSGRSKCALGSRSVQLVHSQGPINGRRDNTHTLRP